MSPVFGLFNKVLSKLPRWVNGFYLDDSHQYSVVNPVLLRAGQSVPRAVLLGQRVFELLTVHALLDPTSRVLDVGCGDGRVAAAFARDENGFRGTYAGFDIDRSRIDALLRLFASNERFTFLHADIFHSYYNRNGRIAAEGYRFPYPEERFDLIFFNSVFPHLKLGAIANNLREAFRCLQASGKVWISCYTLDEHFNPGYGKLSWHFDTTYDGGFTADPRQPEACLAYEKIKLLDLFRSVGFSVQKYVPGYWKQDRTSLDQHEQDVFVLAKNTGDSGGREAGELS